MTRIGFRPFVVACALLMTSLGCAPQPTNPSFPATADFARRDLRRMASAHRPLDYPLVIISGFMDPGFAAVSMRGNFQAATGDSHIVTVTLGECGSFEECRGKVIRAVDKAFPSKDVWETTEVDVVGFSMGGLVARYAANPPPGMNRRLRIHELFTISSPNQGAVRAEVLPLLHPLQADMRPGSPLIRRLNSMPTPYPVYSYIRLGDHAIGPPNAGIPGGLLWWVSTPPFSNPHVDAASDPRIVDDIARRLRHEAPLSTAPPAALPKPPESTARAD